MKKFAIIIPRLNGFNTATFEWLDWYNFILTYFDIFSSNKAIK